MPFWKRKKQPAEQVAPKKDEQSASAWDGFADIELGSHKAAQAYIEQNAVQRTAPTPAGTAMDSATDDALKGGMVSYAQVNPVILAHYVSQGFIGYPAMSIIAQHWLVRKGCESKPRDAARKWYDILRGDGSELDPKQVRAIEALDRRYKLKQNVIEALTFNNIFGVRHVWFKHKNPDFDYSTPFNPDEFKDGGYAGIAQVDPTRCIPEFEDQDLSDPRSIHYLEPTWWVINGTRVHRSHMVILKGDHVPDLLKPTYRYGGVSMAQKVYQRVFSAEKTANEGPKLAMTKRLVWRKTDLSKMVKEPGKFKKVMSKLTEVRDNFGVQLLSDEDEIGQLDTNLTDLDSTIMTQYQLVCSIFDEPASKLLGTGHPGFSTGETDSDYRIESLEELQGNEMTEIVDNHYRRLIPSVARNIGVDADMQIIPEWRPLKVISESETADINLKNRQADKLAYEMQAVDNYDVRERLNKDKFSGFEGLDVPEDEPEEQEPLESANEDKQQQALNGAQVASLADLVFKVKNGEMDKASAIEIIMLAFPVDRENAERIVDVEIQGVSLDEADFIDMALDEITGDAEDAEYQGRTVELNKPFRDSGGSGKFGVYVKNDKGNVVKVPFGDKDMEIKRDDPDARSNFRASHNCSEKTDKTKAGYWSCKFWSSKSVSELLGD